MTDYLNGEALEGRTCRLRSVNQSDYGFIRNLETDPRNLVRYRHRGVSISPEAHIQNVWQGVLSQFIVESKIQSRPIGLVAAYGADFRHSRCAIATVATPWEPLLGPQLEGTRLFIDYLFSVFPLRKLTASVIEFNWNQFSSGSGRIFQEEGLLRDHEYHDGRYWDVHMIAVHRDDWLSIVSRGAEDRLGLASQLPIQSFESFAGALATTFDWDVEELSPSALLVDDLDCDSIGLIELMSLLDDAAGIEVNDEVFTQIRTLGELWHLYLQLTSP